MFGVNSALYLPLLREGECIGLLTLVGKRPNSFGPSEIAQAESFRDQALIAIENTRLFNETKEALEQQTATSEVLQVISSSPGDLEPVFATMLENAVRASATPTFGNIYRWDGDALRLVATHNTPPALRRHFAAVPFRPDPNSPVRSHAGDQRRWSRLPTSQHGRGYIERRDSGIRRRRRTRRRTDGSGRAHAEGERTDRRDSSCTARRFGRSPTSRSSWSRTSPPRPSSPSRTRGCSTSCASARPTSPSRWSSRRRPRRCSRSSQVRPASWSRCSRPCWRMRCASARPSSACCSCARAMRSAPLRLHGVPPAFAERAAARTGVRPAPGTALGRVVETKQVVHIADIRQSRLISKRSAAIAARRAWRRAHHARRADAQGERAGRRHRHLPPGGAAVHRQADRAGAELRRPGGHRHRERAAAQRAAPAHRRSHRVAGAADGDVGGAAGHLKLARRAGAGVRRHAGECRRASATPNLAISIAARRRRLHARRDAQYAARASPKHAARRR